MRFRPSGGLGHGQQPTDRDAIQARADAVSGPPPPERVYEHRHAHEIERAENIAAGLPPEGLPKATPEVAGAGKGGSRESNLATPAPVQEAKPFTPVPIKEQPRGIVETIRNAASNLVKKVQRLIKPVQQIHKEVIINAEMLVAMLDKHGIAATQAFADPAAPDDGDLNRLIEAAVTDVPVLDVLDQSYLALAK